VFLTGSYEKPCGVTAMPQSKPTERPCRGMCPWENGKYVGKYQQGSFGNSKWIKEYNGKGIMNSEHGQGGGKVPGTGYRLDWSQGILQCKGKK
jgi:hypothetical protein